MRTNIASIRNQRAFIAAIHIVACVMLLAVAAPGRIGAADLFAHYTRLDSGQPRERFERVDEYADVVVKLNDPDGRLVFARATSFLPYWQTAKGKWLLDEIVARQGDGPATRPDRVNAYSHVEIIESTASKVVVHWRYLSRFKAGNPHGSLDTNHFVDELFTISPDGRVTRVIKQGTKTIDDWNDPLNQTTQVLKLRKAGVDELSRTKPKHAVVAVPVHGNPQQGPAVGSPRMWFKFDESQGDIVEEAISSAKIVVPGHKTLWKQGVSGTALQFDGYRSAVVLPRAQVPHIDGGDVTLEGWFALGAYPWDWAPIVQQGDDSGYFLGIDGHGYPGFMIEVDGKWNKLSVPNQPPYSDANHLALFRWYHLAGTYNKADGMMRLYVDGKEIASENVGTGGVQTAKADVRVGKAGILRTPVNGLHGTGPSDFGLDGLIDEVKIYDVALTADQVEKSYKKFEPGSSVVAAPDMQKRGLPNPKMGRVFQGVYTRMPYYESWDNMWRFGPYADVVVGFDRLPIKFVFWRGVSYIPMIVNESNQWFSNEFNETGFRPNAPGDCEPMSDKGCWSSHVRILENTPARVVVHWRYRLINPDHSWADYNPATGWGDVCDWYCTIYPDGVAAKRMRCYTSEPNVWHEWDEQMAILGEGQHPESVVKRTPVMTLVDDAGKATAYDWNPNPPQPDYRGKIIQQIHFTGRYSPFTIQKFDGGDVYAGERTGYSVFPSWNHWPTSQINSSGRNSLFPDRAAHSSISHLFWPLSRQQSGDVSYMEKTLMEGMTGRGAASLTGLAKSWLQAPAIEAVSGCEAASYDQSQRAYVLTVTGSAPSFGIAGSADHPIVNLCFLVKNWACDTPAVLQVDSKPVDERSSFRQGIIRDPNGRQMLVVWLELNCTVPKTFKLLGASPVARPAAQPAAWAEPPHLESEYGTASMRAASIAGAAVAYRFECVKGQGHSSNWQSMPLFVDSDLKPQTQFAYRMKTRDYYGNESDWSPVAHIVTGAAPVSVTWNMDESSGKFIKDQAGRHEGELHETVERVPGVRGNALRFDGRSYVEVRDTAGLRSHESFAWAAWIRTARGGTIVARTAAGREWLPGGKALFVRNGRLCFDVGYVGCVEAANSVADGKWHHVVLSASARGSGDNIRLYLDGRLAGQGRLDITEHDDTKWPMRIGFCNEQFPQEQSGFVGDIGTVQWFPYALGPEAAQTIFRSK